MKLGRNDPCSCGSGKKYKNCCLGKAVVNPPRLAAPSTAEINQLDALYSAGRYAELENKARLLVDRFPEFGFGWKMLGLSFQMQGKDALPALQQAARLLPNNAEAHNNLGAALNAVKQRDEAEASFRRAIEIKPDYVEAYCNLGGLLKHKGNLSDARACYRKAGELGYSNAWICSALMLPAIMGTRQEMMESRAEFERNLDLLMAKRVPLDDPLKSTVETNFYLAFQGLNDRELQVKVAKYYEQACPSLLYTAPHCAKPKSGDRKIQIGFISSFFYDHSVSRCFGKVIETISLREQFEVTLISNRPIDERLYSGVAGRRVHLPHDLAVDRKIIAALELDILIYLDIGMDPLSYFLAFSRLARMQCVLSGHPVTTGITNMDHYLSNDLMEPDDAEDHYSENLVRLSGPLFYFERPKLPDKLKTREQLGLPEGRHIYMCPMKLQKIHPDFDEAITRILQIDGNGVIVLFEDNNFPGWKIALESRFEKTVPSSVRERIIFLPWLNTPQDFISAIAAADVVLDTFHFGIGSTAIMTFATGTPIVTKAGEFMRGRVGLYLCKMLDLHECIAEDTETYAQKAVEIAGNRLLRDTISAKMRENSSVLYGNVKPVHELADFLYSLRD